MTTATQAPPKSLTLYDIPARYRELEEQIIEADGELTPEVEAELDSLQDAFERKAEYIALLSREARAEAKAVKEEEDRLKARRTAAENRESRLKDYLQACLTRAGVDRVEGDRIKARIQDNSRPSIRWMGEEDAIPEPFKRVRVDLDGSAAYETWKDGEPLPEGFVVETGRHLRIW